MAAAIIDEESRDRPADLKSAFPSPAQSEALHMRVSSALEAGGEPSPDDLATLIDAESLTPAVDSAGPRGEDTSARALSRDDFLIPVEDEGQGESEPGAPDVHLRCLGVFDSSEGSASTGSAIHVVEVDFLPAGLVVRRCDQQFAAWSLWDANGRPTAVPSRLPGDFASRELAAAALVRRVAGLALAGVSGLLWRHDDEALGQAQDLYRSMSPCERAEADRLWRKASRDLKGDRSERIRLINACADILIRSSRNPQQKIVYPALVKATRLQADRQGVALVAFPCTPALERARTSDGAVPVVDHLTDLPAGLSFLDLEVCPLGMTGTRDRALYAAWVRSVRGLCLWLEGADLETLRRLSGSASGAWPGAHGEPQPLPARLDAGQPADGPALGAGDLKTLPKDLDQIWSQPSPHLGEAEPEASDRDRLPDADREAQAIEAPLRAAQGQEQSADVFDFD